MPGSNNNDNSADSRPVDVGDGSQTFIPSRRGGQSICETPESIALREKLTREGGYQQADVDREKANKKKKKDLDEANKNKNETEAQRVAREKAERIAKLCEARKNDIDDLVTKGAISRPSASTGPENANIERMRHLTGYSWEGIAVKMVMQELIFFLKCLSLLVHDPETKNYNHLKETRPDLILDLSSIGPDGPADKQLYEIEYTDGHMSINYERPIEIKQETQADGKIAHFLDYANRPSGITDAIVIMANGFMPPHNIVDSLSKELANYVTIQLGFVTDQYRRDAQALLHKNAQSAKAETTSTKKEENVVAIQGLNKGPAGPAK